MTNEIATLRRLQAGLNANFEAVYAANNAKTLASAKEALVKLGYATAGTALGPIFSLMGLGYAPMQFMATRIGVDLGLFKIIAAGPSTLAELAEKTNANPRLIKRILRVLAAMGQVEQKEPNKWGPTPQTFALISPAVSCFMTALFGTLMGLSTPFPEWLQQHDYQTSWAGSEDNIYQQVFGTDAWSYFEKHPEKRAQYDTAMSIQEQFPPEMVPPYPFPAEVEEIRTGSDAVTFVDLGGGNGQAIESLKAAYPNLSGRFILQDLPEKIKSLDAAKVKQIGFEPMIHDFFEPQPVKGAKYYHLRRVMHDWNDESGLKILVNTRLAMEPGYSKVLISEFVIADVHPGPVEVLSDLLMMMSHDGCERDESEWHELLGKAGLKIEKILRADMGNNCVIEASVA